MVELLVMGGTGVGAIGTLITLAFEADGDLPAGLESLNQTFSGQSWAAGKINSWITKTPLADH